MGLRFCDCVLDPSCFELKRRGRLVKLEPKVFDVLLHLIEHRRRVVTKQELLDALWPGEAVSDSVLPRCIAAARRAVGDTRTRQEVIATVHGRGYRFVATVLEQADPPPATEWPEDEASGSASTDQQAATAALRPRSDRATVDFETGSGEHESPDPDPVFVGRLDVMEKLERLVDRAEKGRGSVALVVGEPGIGKTSLAEALARRARARGFEVLIGRCYEGEGAPAYWPWIQVLREAAAATRDDAALRAQLGFGAPVLAELVPELGERLGETRPLPGGGSNQARFRLYEAASRFLAARAGDRPLLLLVDDLHWADASSLGLLRFLARATAEERVVLLGTYRDVDVRRGHPLKDVLGALARESSCERLALAGLDRAEVAAFVERLTGRPAEHALVTRLAEMTDGNPFFLREIVHLLVDQAPSPTADQALDSLVLPQGIKDAIGRRLDVLSPECNDLLRAAAVLGRDFRLTVLEAMEPPESAHEREGLLELLGEALDAGVIAETVPGRYVFGHALTRQTLYEELRSPQRIALHRRAATAIERALGVAVGDDDQGRHAELAHHYFEAAPGGDVDRAIESAIAAAESCHRKHAYDEAESFYLRALEALELAVPIDVARRAELTLALGQARFVAGARERALPTLRRAATLARPLGRVDLMARAAIAMRGSGEMGTPPEPHVVELIHECLAGLPEDERTLRASLLSRLNGAAAASMAERADLARRAVELAEDSGDPISLRDAYGAESWATLGPDRISERTELARKLHALADRTGEPRVRLQAIDIEIGVALLRGDFDATERSIGAFERIAAELRQPMYVFMGMSYRTSWLINRGRYDEAAERVESARRFGLGVVPFAEAVCSGQLYWARSARGDRTDADLHVLDEVLSEGLRERAVSQAFLASLRYSVASDAERAIELIEGIELDAMDRDENWLLALTTLAWLAVDVGRRDLIEWLHDALRPYDTLIGIHDLLRAAHSSVASALGLLSAGLDDLDRSVEDYERAIALEERADMRAALAGSHLGLARTLRRRRRKGDRKRADRLVESGEAICRELQLGPLSRPRILLGHLQRTGHA